MASSGSGGDTHRIRTLSESREKGRAAFEERVAAVKRDAATVRGLDDAFASHSTIYEQQFKAKTVGLLTAEEFRKQRLKIEKKRKLDEIKLEKKKQKKHAVKKKQAVNLLSFDVDEDNEAENSTACAIADGLSIMKNPDVDTSFLPDRRRDAEEEELRAKLEAEYIKRQIQIKEEEVEITYSYWDGSGHRRTTTIKKGFRIDQFLEKVRRELAPDFLEIRNSSAENLLFIKEDLILPHYITFYELIVSKARGKTGPLFSFDVRDDVRLRSDARVEKEETHAGKVMLRSWYERNKHIHPASRWEIYDSKKDYGMYV